MKTLKTLGVVLVGLLLSISQVGWAQHGHRKHDGHDGKGRHGKDYYGNRANVDGKRNLSAKIYRLTQADSIQQKKMQPIVAKAEKRLIVLRTKYQEQEKKVLDSLRLQLKPILKEDQWKRLEDFKNKNSDKGK
jgi:hypothetical protein